MSSEAERNIDVMRSAFDALNRGEIEACTRLMKDDFIINIAGMPYQKRGLAAWRENVRIMRNALPDLKVVVDDILAAGDKLAVRATISGTHHGEFLGNPPTGRKVSYLSYEIYRFEDGALAEEWICPDSVTMMTQMGAFSQWRLVTMWLTGFRLWLGLAIGAACGVAVGVAL